MNLTSKPMVNLALVLAAGLSITACASAPKPLPLAEPTAPPPSAEQGAPPPPPVSEQSVGAIPGSTQDFVINAGDRVYFDFDAYAIRDDAQPVLAKQADWLRQYPDVQIRIEGNCDERGTREYNFALGARRANAVKDFLVAHGVSAARITTVSYGKERPIDAGDGEDAWAHNRNAHTDLTSGAR